MWGVPLFRRGNTATDETQSSDVPDRPAAQQTKGRPTPTRKAAESSRKLTVKIPSDPKAAKAAARERTRNERIATRQALSSGDDRHLPARDAGPVKAYVRDYIDRRRSAGEFFIPIAVGVVVLSFIRSPVISQVVTLAWLMMLVGVIIDVTIIILKLRRELPARFPDESHRGANTYAIMRSVQIRKLRLPKPKIKAGGKPVVPKAKKS